MRPHATFLRRGLLAVAAVVAAVLACEPDAAPTGLTAPVTASRSAATTGDLASPGWQAIEANLVAQANLAAVVSTHAYSLLGVAHYLSVQRAEGSRRGRRAVAGRAPLVPQVRAPVSAGPSAGVRIRGLPGGTGGDPSHRRHPHHRADRDRHGLGAGCGHTYDRGLLAPGCNRRHQFAPIVGAAGDAPLCVAQRLDVRRANRVLGRE